MPSPVTAESFLRSATSPFSEDKLSEAVRAQEEGGHRGEQIAVEETSGLVFIIISNRIIRQSRSAACLACGALLSLFPA